MSDQDIEDIKAALKANTLSAQGDLQGTGLQEQTPLQRYVLSPLGKTLDFLDTDLNVVTNALRPVFEGLNPKLKEVYDSAPVKMGIPNVTPSDLIEKSFEGVPGNKVTAKVLGFAADVALSPSTYLAGLGALTKEGKLFSAIKAIAEQNKVVDLTGLGERATIELNSDLGKQIAEHYGAPRATAALVGRAIKDASVFRNPTLEEQALQGRRALVNIGIPFTHQEIPLIQGQLFFRGVDKGKDLLKESKFGELFTNLFSTSSGNPVFDRIRQTLNGLKGARELDVQTLGTNIGKAAESVSKEYGLDIEDSRKMIQRIVESSYLKDVDAKSILKVFGDGIDKQVVSGEDINKTIDNIPGIQNLAMDERGKLFRALERSAKEKQAGFDVFTTGFQQLDPGLRNVFVKEMTQGLGIKMARDIKSTGRIEWTDFPRVVEAYSRGVKHRGLKFDPGVEAGLYAMVGRGEYKRLIEAEKLAQGGITEAAQQRDVVRRIIAHVDQQFSLGYTLYKTNPQFLQQFDKRMYQLMDKIDTTPEWKVKNLQDMFHFSLEDAQKYPHIFDIAQDVRKFYQNQLQLEQDAGVPITEWIGPTSYDVHVLTKDAREALQKRYPEYSNATREWNRDHVSTLQRQLANLDVRKINEAVNTGKISRRLGKNLLDKATTGNYSDELVSKLISTNRGYLLNFLTVSEANAMAKAGKLRILKGVTLDKGMFEVNPAYQVLVRGIRGERARTAMDFYNAARQFGTLHDVSQALPEGMEFVKNAKANPLAAPEFTKLKDGTKIEKRLIFDAGVAKHLNALHEALTLPAASHPLLSLFDGIQTEWKAWTLSVFPAYHTRNVIGNIWNNYLAGIHIPDPYIKALKVQQGKPLTIETASGKKYSTYELRNLYKYTGAGSSGQYWGDIEDYFKTELDTGIKKYYKQFVRPPANFGLKVGNYLENNAKMALFIRRLEEGLTPEAAAMDVKKYLFDYKDLTDSEREIFKRVFPFYTWTRKNIPLQLEALLTHPSRLMTVGKIRNVMESNYDGVPDERLLPDYMTQNFPIRVRYDQDRKQFEYFLLGSWLPASDIDKIFDPLTWVKNSLTPLLKEPAQQLANRDFFTNREIDSGDEYQTINILNKQVNVPARVGHALRNVRLISEIDKLSAPDDLTPFGKFIRFGTGKLYPFDEEKQLQFTIGKYKDQEGKLKAQLKRAAEKDNQKEVDRIIGRLNKLQEDLTNKVQ